MNSAVPRLIDINELALLLSLKRGTLYNWVYLRRIPFVKIGGALRFDPVEVDRVMRKMPIIDQAGRGRRSN